MKSGGPHEHTNTIFNVGLYYIGFWSRFFFYKNRKSNCVVWLCVVTMFVRIMMNIESEWISRKRLVCFCGCTADVYEKFELQKNRSHLKGSNSLLYRWWVNEFWNFLHIDWILLHKKIFMEVVVYDVISFIENQLSWHLFWVD